MGDLILILSIKLLIIFGGNYLLISWLRKNATKLKVFVCWVLGFILNFYQPFTIYEGILKNFFVNENELLLRKDSLDSLAVILATITFFIVGAMFYKKKVT
jgi:hypothetical protein